MIIFKWNCFFSQPDLCKIWNQKLFKLFLTKDYFCLFIRSSPLTWSMRMNMMMKMMKTCSWTCSWFSRNVWSRSPARTTSWRPPSSPLSKGQEGRKEMFYLTTHSTHFIYGYMASDIWLRTILIVRKEIRCRHIGYSYRLTARVLLYAPSHRQDNTYHGLCYTSRGALAGTRNSSKGQIG